MKPRVIIGLGVAALVVATPFVTTWLEEWRLYSRDRIVAEIGYPIPQDSKITDTSASIWSLADGANFSWSITSATSLLPWIESIGKLEYDRTYRVYKVLADGRGETSYVSLASDSRSATVETFRP
jgi:hypothetical protein